MSRARDGRAGRAWRPLGLGTLGLGTLGLAALGLGVAGDAEPRRELAPCRTSAVAVQVYEGSRLFEAPGDRLDLSDGRQLDCDHPATQRVLDELAQAVGSLHGATPDLLARIAAPLRVHLDPRLPSRQAPLAGIEVHVSRRELLVARAVLDELGPGVWRHELLHTLAAPPPASSSQARHLWLTLEEALVSHVERASQGGREAAPGSAGRSAPGARPRSSAPARRALPAGTVLASAAYDPHPLAAGLARELERSEAAVPVGAWLSCLAAQPAALPAGAATTDVFQAFSARCSPATAAELSRSIGGWWVEPETLAGLVFPRGARARKAAARAGESR